MSRTDNLADGCANQVAAERTLVISSQEKDKMKVNKFTILAKIVLLWTAFYFLFLFPSVFFGQVFTLLNGSVALTGLVFIYLSFFSIYHYRANKNRKENIYLTFRKENGIYHAGIPLCIYMPKNRHKIVTILVNAICEQFQKENIPVMMRSHFLDSPATFMKKMRKNHISCSATAGPEIPTGWRRFMLFWVTPVIIGSFQWHLPTINLRETELMLTRGSYFEQIENTVNTDGH